MTYQCENCGAIFYEPDRRGYKENLDDEDGWWEYEYDVCPQCGSDLIITPEDLCEDFFF